MRQNWQRAFVPSRALMDAQRRARAAHRTHAGVGARRSVRPEVWAACARRAPPPHGWISRAGGLLLAAHHPTAWGRTEVYYGHSLDGLARQLPSGALREMLCHPCARPRPAARCAAAARAAAALLLEALLLLAALAGPLLWLHAHAHGGAVSWRWPLLEQLFLPKPPPASGEVAVVLGLCPR